MGFALVVPVHNNYSQVESHAPLIEISSKSYVLVYPSNPSGSAMKSFYSRFPNTSVMDFSTEAILSVIASEALPIVVVLSSSDSHDFGAVQRRYFLSLKAAFPERVIDVFPVGHCMFGCTSSSFHDHNIPIRFTRYFNGTLPLTKASVEAKYCKRGIRNVLVCPAYSDSSLIYYRDFFENLKTQSALNIVVKLHNQCFEAETADSPLSYLSEREFSNVDYIRSNFSVVPEDEYCLLPFIDAFDVVVCDLNSSVPFEALFFPPRPILTFLPRGLALDICNDVEYMSHFSTFSTSTELSALLDGELKPARDGRAFFASKYGVIDGHEAQRIASQRKWSAASPTASVPISRLRESFLSALGSEFSEEERNGMHSLIFDGFISPHAKKKSDWFASNSSQLADLKVPRRLWKVATWILL